MNEVRFNLKSGKQVRSRGGGGAIGAVDEDTQTAQIVLHGSG